MQQPQWAEVPNWVNWMAQDSDGIWWGYEAKPDLLDRGFGRLNGTRFGSEPIILLQHGRPVRRWRDSLQSRPV